MFKPVDILMVGVGGQGAILASRVLARAAREAGYDLKVSEIHGMAQRGGSVVTQVRLGTKVYSPLITRGGADIILAFEKLEAFRHLSFLKSGGTVIVNDQEIAPVPVLAGAAVYPPGIIGHIRSAAKNVVVVQARDMALKCGNAKAANIILLGVLAKKLPIKMELWERALAGCVRPGLLEVNQAAFVSGYGNG